jgi:signal recognition particle subunit SRP19
MRKSGNYYIYPAYFEANRSRQSGRRVPKKLAFTKVDTKLITRAAQRLGLEFTVNGKARYPASWWSASGLVLIKKPPEETKTQLLIKLAKIMRTLKEAGVK